jgi:hypothetical protein
MAQKGVVGSCCCSIDSHKWLNLALHHELSYVGPCEELQQNSAETANSQSPTKNTVAAGTAKHRRPTRLLLPLNMSKFP